jgi:RNA polymerase sigma-70 factor (ECF subfamily)
VNGEAPQPTEAHYAEIYRFIRRRRPGAADDLTQEVFAQAARTLELSGRHEDNILGWLYTVARRRLIDHARKTAREAQAIRELEVVTAQTYSLDYGYDVARALRAAIATLSEKDQTLVRMRLVQGRPFKEIAQRIGLTEPATKMRFSRALNSLREVLRSEGVAPND